MITCSTFDSNCNIKSNGVGLGPLCLSDLVKMVFPKVGCAGPTLQPSRKLTVASLGSLLLDCLEKEDFSRGH